MKTNIFLKTVAGIVCFSAVASGMTSCGDDYLDIAPVTSYTVQDVGSSIEGARAAKVGLLQGMYRQLSSDLLKYSGANGEPFMATFYGDIFGDNFISNLRCGHSTSMTTVNWTNLRDYQTYASYEMWAYCYSLIKWSNMILTTIDDLDSYNGERDFIKANALAVRAHMYTRLLQCYAPNWENSNDGNVKCVVLRLPDSENDVPFSTMNEVLDLIYSDFQEAISLFDSCGWSRQYIWEVNGNVARGLFARAASIKHDYQLAQQMAHEAWQGYKIMSADQYCAGFIRANDEYMWATMWEEPAASIYYYSHGTYNACNGRYQNTWGYAINAIDYTFYKKFPLTDCRKRLYLTPEMLTFNQELADKYGATPEDFFDESKIYTNGIRIQVNSNNTAMSKFVRMYGMEEYNRLNAIVPFGDGTVTAYCNASAEIIFGAQFKFWGNQIYGINQFPYMRASEMGYLEAEMAWRNGDEALARQLLIALNKDVRDPQFECTKSGEELLQTIKDYREFELWGEGFNWYDLKRWHDPIVRIPWEAGNPDSGNRGEFFNQNYGPDDFYGWVVAVPRGEYLYNSAVNQAELPGGVTDPEGFE